MLSQNKGFDPEEIQDIKEKIKESGLSFLYNDDEEQGEEFAQFFFVGTYKGQEVIFDAVIYTLRMAHNGKLYEIADQKAAEKFPNYKPWDFEEDEEGNLTIPDDLDDEIESYKADIMLDLEEEESVKVQEQVVFDDAFEYGVGLEASLNVEEITEEVIENFVTQFNNGTLKLDPTLYAFQHDDEDDEDEF